MTLNLKFFTSHGQPTNRVMRPPQANPEVIDLSYEPHSPTYDPATVPPPSPPPSPPTEKKRKRDSSSSPPKTAVEMLFICQGELKKERDAHKETARELADLRIKSCNTEDQLKNERARISKQLRLINKQKAELTEKTHLLDVSDALRDKEVAEHIKEVGLLKGKIEEKKQKIRKLHQDVAFHQNCYEDLKKKSHEDAVDLISQNDDLRLTIVGLDQKIERMADQMEDLKLARADFEQLQRDLEVAQQTVKNLELTLQDERVNLAKVAKKNFLGLDKETQRLIAEWQEDNKYPKRRRVRPPTANN